MATFNERKIVDILIAGNGFYPGDELPVVKIVEYTNIGGKRVYGVIYQGEPLEKYYASDYVKDPTVLWERKVSDGDHRRPLIRKHQRP